MIFIATSALRLLALRGLRTLRVRRVALRAPGVTQSKLFLEFFSLYIYIGNKGQRIIFHMDPIFEIYTPENPMSTVEIKFLA